jgi:hypothetical protein
MLKVRLKLLLAEMKSLRSQLLAVRHLANQTAVLELGSDTEKCECPTQENGLFLILQEDSALESAISAATLAHWGAIDSTGRILSESGQVVSW